MANSKIDYIISRVNPLFKYLSKQRESHRFIRSVEITSTFILITFFLLFAIKPTVYTISSLVGEIKSKELLKKEMRQKINNIVKAQNNYALLQEKYYLLESALPERPEFSAFYDQVAKAATDSGISLTKVNFSFNKDDANLKAIKTNVNLESITLPLSVKSEYISLKNFFSHLLHQRRLTHISQVSFTQDSSTKSIESSTSATASPTGHVVMSTYLNAFYWSPKTTNEK